jgi:hypothetical protein
MRKRTLVAVLSVLSSIASAGDPPDACKRKVVDQSYLATATLNDLRSIRLALGNYLKDHAALPPGTTIEGVPALIHPTYIRTAVVVDAWGMPFLFEVSPDGKSFTVASAGSDRTFDRASWAEAGLQDGSQEDAVLSSDRAADREWVIQE